MVGSKLGKNFKHNYMFVFDWISYITLSEHTTWVNCLKIKKNGSSCSETAVIALHVIYMLSYSILGLCGMLHETELKYYKATWDTEVGYCIHNKVPKCATSDYVFD